MTTLIRNGTLVNADKSHRADLLIESQRIKAIAPNLPQENVRSWLAGNKSTTSTCRAARLLFLLHLPKNALRHEHVGRGFVGTAAFAVICGDARFARVPKILETAKAKDEKGRDWDAVNLEVLKGLM